MTQQQDTFVNTVDDTSLFTECRQKTNQVTHIINELRSYLSKLKQLKQQQKLTSSSSSQPTTTTTTTSTSTDNMEMKIHLTKGVSLFLRLRSAHREACAMNERLNQRRFHSQSQTDQISLRLSNLQYEAYHLQKQIQECRQFHSRHTDIPLVSEQEFINSAPDDLKQNFSETENDETDEKKKHERMMSRLEFELLERRRLKGEIESLIVKQDVVKQDMIKKREFVDGLRNNLGTIRDHAVSIQSRMMSTIPPTEKSILPEEQIQEIDHARKLPFPLYTLFNKLDIYRKQQSSPHYEVQVKIRESSLTAVFSATAAATPQQSTTPLVNDPSESTKTETDRNQDNDTEVYEPSSKRRRLTKKATAHDAQLKPHPLSILVQINSGLQSSSTGAKKSSLPPTEDIVIEFFYISSYNIVTVAGSIEKQTIINQILPHLFPNDSGQETSNAERLSDFDFSEYECGRPYRWAQSLCGLHVLPPVPLERESDKIQYFTINSIIDIIRYKVRAGNMLAFEIKELQAKRAPKHPLPNMDTSALRFTHNVKLHSFAKLTDVDNSSIFMAQFKAGNFILQCEVKVNRFDYPLIPPTISKLEFVKNAAHLSRPAIPEHLRHLIKNAIVLDDSESDVKNTDLLDIEYESNVLFPMEYVKYYAYDMTSNSCHENHYRLLSHQMTFVAQCIMVLLHIESEQGNISSPITTPSKICMRERRGRDRRLPFTFHQQLGLFTHST